MESRAAPRGAARAVRRQALRATGADVAKGEMYGREVDPVKVPNEKEILAEIGRHEVRLDENSPGATRCICLR